MENSARRDRLPRLVYIGDVPVESTYHGSLLLYRLLSNYPKDKLLIVETDLGRSAPERRLPDVEYQTLRVPLSRLAYSRFSKPYFLWLFLTASHRCRKIDRQVREFRPEAIITIVHFYHWITADQLAKQLRIPLHLIVHDNFVQAVMLPQTRLASSELAFGHVYATARSRMCVSPYMESEYKQRFGVSGTVLYPSRSADFAHSETPPLVSNNSQSLRVAFAGSINSGGYARLLRLLAQCLASEDKLFLFGPHTVDSLKRWDLSITNIQLGGLLPSGDLLRRLSADFDVLFVPMSFDAEGHAENMRLSFPSKIADYSATGLPLLICAPEYSSAVRWARDYAPVAEIVTSETDNELRTALSRLRSSAHRRSLGNRAFEVGAQLFSYEKAEATLYGALSS